jgi:tRNA threonylcarbamoyladenosine biosynthesis protein TsaE
MEWIFSEEQLASTAESFWQYYKGQHVFTLEGPMGAGKTTFVKALCAAKGVEDATASPTFSIINEYAYREKNGQLSSIYHLDLYRLRDEEEAIAAGVEDTIYHENAISFVEWPEVISHLLPPDTIRLRLFVLPDKKRLLQAG